MDWRSGDSNETPAVMDHESEAYERDVVARVYDEVMADPSKLLTAEELLSSMREWDREDGLVEVEEPLKRSA